MNAVVSQKGADFLWSEGVGAGRHPGQQGVLHGVLHAELLEVCGGLRHLEGGNTPTRHGVYTEHTLGSADLDGVDSSFRWVRCKRGGCRVHIERGGAARKAALRRVHTQSTNHT